jgi:hypothetical protein
VVLDHRSKETVEFVVGDQQVLELVKADDCESAIGFMEAQRHV